MDTELYTDHDADDWEAFFDEDSQYVYYFNKKSQSTTWTPPSEYSSSSDRPRMRSQSQALPRGWKIVYDEEGNPFHYNTDTKELKKTFVTNQPSSMLKKSINNNNNDSESFIDELSTLYPSFDREILQDIYDNHKGNHEMVVKSIQSIMEDDGFHSIGQHYEDNSLDSLQQEFQNVSLDNNVQDDSSSEITTQALQNEINRLKAKHTAELAEIADLAAKKIVSLELRAKKFRKLLEDFRCVVCMSRKRSVVFLDCNHFVACYQCSVKLQQCPMCRSKFREKRQLFMN